MRNPTELDALYAFLVAAAVTALLTPLTMRFARAVGAIDEPRERGLSERPTPLLGGLAIFAGRARRRADLAAGGLRAKQHQLWHGVLLAAALITLVGALDDRFDLPPAVKLAGQVVAAVIVVHFGVAVKAITLPFVGSLAFPNAGVTNAGPVLTVIGLVAMMNVVNFSDGVDGLAAGVCAIIAAALAVIAFDLNRAPAGRAGGAHGRRGARLPDLQLPARVELHGRLRREPARPADGRDHRRGGGQDDGRGLLRAAPDPARVPFLDTTFVVLKRLKYRQPIYQSDSEHFHHRMARIGFSSRRTIAYLYAWTLMLAGLALALRFVPYSRPPRPPAHRLDAGDDRARAARRRRERLPRVRARDPQVPAPGRDRACGGCARMPQRRRSSVTWPGTSRPVRWMRCPPSRNPPPGAQSFRVWQVTCWGLSSPLASGRWISSA